MNAYGGYICVKDKTRTIIYPVAFIADDDGDAEVMLRKLAFERFPVSDFHSHSWGSVMLPGAKVVEVEKA